MKKILLAGASGVLGIEMLKILHQQAYTVRALIRDATKAPLVQPYCDEVVVGDATDPSAIEGVCEGIDIVFSVVGKSVSLFTNSPASFFDIDYRANVNLLAEAQRARVARFVYVSIFGSETSHQLRVGWSQERFAQLLLQASISHTVIKPVGMFSGLHDLILMGKRGLLITPGTGRPVTNPIHQQDLAEVCVQYLEEGPTVLAVGGPETHSRNEVAALVAQHTHARTLNIPHWLALTGLRFLRPFSQNLYDKLRYFTYITTHDMVAPSYGRQTFETYLKTKKF